MAHKIELRARSMSALNAYIQSTIPGTARIYFTNELHSYNADNPSTRHTYAQLANLLSEGFDSDFGEEAPARPAIKQFFLQEEPQIKEMIREVYKPYAGGAMGEKARKQGMSKGAQVAKRLRRMFVDFVSDFGVSPANTPYTQRMKGVNTPPWINTGELLSNGLATEFTPKVPKRIRGDYFGTDDSYDISDDYGLKHYKERINFGNS
jgi:hypothetical protein